jgi:hypothetical protein
MRYRVQSCLALLLLATASLVARAGEQDIQLKDDAAAVAVRANCSICHSLDYIQMNSPFMKRAGWEAEVRKMIKVMGAPVAEPDVAPLVDYLTKYYGQP